MKRVYQTNINQPTQELTEQVLRNVTELPENNALIDEYRQLKRAMAEAEARQEVEAFVKEITESQDYQDWLKPELKRDEKRRKKENSWWNRTKRGFGNWVKDFTEPE